MAIESVGGSLVSKIAALSVEPVIKQFRYMFCFNNFVQEFNDQVRSLVLALYRLQVAVDDATKNAEEIEIYVNTWLEDAKKALALYGLQDAVNVATKNAEEIEIDVNKWLEDAKNEMEGVDRLENEKGKCFTWCPKWIRQFKLSKALEKKTETLRKLEEEGKKFQKVAHKVPLQDIEFLPSKELTPSESSKEAFEQIMKALKDDNINMIGLYGMGGVGKTTLVKEVGRRAKETQLIDEVLLATVSQNPNVKNIQDRMAESLGLQFHEETKEGRAFQLWQRLKTEKKLLVILDDVWQDVNLLKIGIPFGDADRGCKVLLTTRDRHICFHMQCQQQVLLSILSENEAWALFKINAGLRDEDSNLNTVAEEVARECQGLPIALVTVGRALRDKSTVEWEVASKQLKNSEFQHMELIGEEKNIYSCLKLSYDYLKHEKTKLCFLLCCLFPEDYDIPIEDLTRYAVGYGLHQDVESIEDARKEVYVAIKTLKDCCMLLGTETEESVKMHDLVRDVAIQIASSKEHGFMVKAGIGLKEWPRSFEGCTTISLMGNQLTELPEGLVFPQLKVLLLELDSDLNVPARFFEGMKEIEVLSLKGGCLSLQSLEFSTNLKSLLLIDCECNDLISLRKLQRLEILVFIGWISLEELPDEIGELKELRLLDVTDCSSLRRIPANLIGRLKKLEELLIGDYSFNRWDVVGCDSTGGMNASLTELNLLSHLAVLSLKIPRVECLPRDFVFPRLLKYDIVLGNGYSKTAHPTSPRLYLNDIRAASLNAKTFEQLFPTVSQICFIDVEGLENIVFGAQMTSHGHGSQKDFLQSLEYVKVKGCRDTRTLFPAKWRQALNNLTSVEIEDCESLEEVFELGEAGEGSSEVQELRMLSSLTRLLLRRLPELKCIWKGPTRHVSLRSLVHLELQFLDKLTFIFTLSLAQSLDHLETLRIDYCSGLKHLIGEEKDDEREIIPESLGFPKLKTLSISGCDQLEYVFPVSVSPSLLNLEVMRIEFGDNLKQIFYSGEGDALTRDGIINIPQLRELSLSRCDFCGPKNFTAQLPSLQVLAIEGHEELGDFLAQLQGHTNLRKIHITACKGAQELMQVGSFATNRRTSHGSQKDFLQRLEDVKVKGCRDTRTLFPAKWRQALNNLTSVEIEDCKSLEEVFELGEAGEGINEEKELRLLSSLTRLRLSRLPELKCIWKGPTRHVSLRSLIHLELRSLHKLTFIFTPHLAQSLVHLETLRIDYCSGLKHLIGEEKDDEREIIPESLGFPKLKTLSISGCHKLEYVFPVSVSPSLLNLEEMTIVFDAKLKQIFYSGEGDALTRDGIINIPQLRKFTLSNCCSVFGPRNFTAQLPSLQVLAIEGHEELGDLLAQLQGLTNLRVIRIIDCERAPELMQVGSFGTNGRTGHELSLLSLEKLDLSSLPDMRCIWKGLVLSHLTTLEVSDCQKLTHVFTGSMVASLVQLKLLVILACEELEQIIAKDNDDEKDQILSGSDLQSLCFPNLCEIFIMRCNKLRSLFPVAMAAGLPKLEDLDVRDSSQLLGVFWQDDHASPVSVEKQMVFPNLSSLRLYNLQSIVCFSLGCDDFLFPRLGNPMVDKCPKLATKFANKTNGSTSAQSEGHTNLRKIRITDCKGEDRRTGHEFSLEEEGKKFQKVAHKVPLQDIEFLPSKELTPSESSKEAFEQIMKALKDDNINMIGLYGMGGVGKTTLVKEVGRRAKETQLIDEVLLATVSQNPNVKNIQDRMAESLGLQFHEETKEGRAFQLWQRLKTEKKLLVILDDVWQDVNLLKIGIPFGDADRGCKVLLTTRDRHICFHMQCQQQVLLSILSENEAWALFKINAGLRDEDSNLNTVAEEVARECQGLPIALVTVGRALRDKSTVEWEVASKQLKNSEFQHMELIGEQKNIYSCLKLSYDYLKHEKTKLCFLLCCLFPEDYDIPIEDLTRYAVGYGLHQDVESIEDARKEVYVAIKTLKDCCMLLGTETEEKVKMHDLVRDVAIQIASSKEHGFMVKAGIGLKEWPRSNKSFEGCTTISLMGNELAELPEGLACPQLKVLLLELGEYLNVPARFFEGMEEIEVLSLKGGCLSLQSLEFSTNLKSLLLIDCECNDLISLRKLQRLEILCFIGSSSLEELPDEIGELKELRLLDVTGCKSPIKIPVNLIGRLKKLEELLIGGYSLEGWGVVGCDSAGGMNASLTELNLLSHLAVLSLRIPRVECIPRDFVFPRLLKYDIVLGNRYSGTAYPTSTRLYLRGISAASLNAKTFEHLFPTVSQIGFFNVVGLENILSCDQMTSHGHGSQKDFLQRLEDVKVKGCRDTRTLFPAKWRQALNNLTRVEIEDCESLEEVFELGEAGEGINEEKELRLLSSLTRLTLSHLPELKCIWKGPTRHVSLRSLIHLELRSLHKLTFIFTPSLAQSLVHLETLQIENCSGLKHLMREKDDESEIIPEPLGFPKLKTLSIGRCDKLEYVFPVSVSPSLLNLEEMTIVFDANLKQIFYSGEGDALTRDGIINIPQLREFTLSNCCSVFGPRNFTAQLPSLQVLAIKGHEELGDLLAQLQGHTNLRKIHITACKGEQELMQVGSFATNRRTSHGSQKDFLQRLEDVKVKGCRDTRTLFPAKWRQALNNLTSVEIEDYESLEEVFELGEAGEGINEEKELRLLSSLTRLTLSHLPELKCIWKGPTRHVSLRSLIHLELRSLHKLTFIFTPSLAQSLVHLETLQIENCSGLKHLMREKDDESEIIPEPLGFPKLKTLSIGRCDKLEYVFPVSVSPSLLNLEEMTIVFDAKLKRIFYSGEGDALTRDGIINIPQLREFTLSNCCSFFGPRNFTAQLPSLQVLAIKGHEELGDLLAQLQGLTNLRVIRIIDCERAPELMQVGSFGTNGRTGHELSLLSLEKLELTSMPDMRCIWKGLVLSHLTSLKVSRCQKLTHVFTGSMVASLVQLQFLKISYCEELEQIIAKDNDDEKDQILSGSDLQSLCFPNLCKVVIYRCNKLRSLFPVAMAAGLPKLQTLDVAHSSQVLGVFGQDDDASPVNVEKQMVLPNLSFLKLENLPSIVCFSLGCDDFLFPRLRNPMVYECPKLTTQFARKSNGSTSA